MIIVQSIQNVSVSAIVFDLCSIYTKISTESNSKTFS